VISVVVAAALSPGLVGCGAIPGSETRYGPAQTLDIADVETETTRQSNVMQSFANGAGYPNVAPTHDPRWYDVTLAGYNYVDEKCDAYLRQLFILEREKNRAKDSIVQVDKLTGAILGASGAAPASIQIVAQAFGFGSTMTTIMADSYLYSVPLPTLFTTEERLRKVYRDEAATNRAAIDNRAAAYQSVRGYLALCFPQTIESKVIGAVAGATVTPSDGKTGDTPKKTGAPPPKKGASSSILLQMNAK
jgi:hypothetical protein